MLTGSVQTLCGAAAWATTPAYVMAEGPIGSLDAATGEAVMAQMLELNREAGTTLVLITHDQGLAARCERQLRIEAGRLVA